MRMSMDVSIARLDISMQTMYIWMSIYIEPAAPFATTTKLATSVLSPTAKPRLDTCSLFS